MVFPPAFQKHGFIKQDIPRPCATYHIAAKLESRIVWARYCVCGESCANSWGRECLWLAGGRNWPVNLAGLGNNGSASCFLFFLTCTALTIGQFLTPRWMTLFLFLRKGLSQSLSLSSTGVRDSDHKSVLSKQNWTILSSKRKRLEIVKNPNIKQNNPSRLAICAPLEKQILSGLLGREIVIVNQHVEL